MKTCITCKQTKEPTEFTADKTYPDGRRNECRPCKNKRAQANRAAKTAERKLLLEYAEKAIYGDLLTTHKHCARCDTLKPFSEYHKHSRLKNGIASACKSCRSVESAKYRAENAETIRKWFEENREYSRQYGKERRTGPENRARINKQKREAYQRDSSKVRAMVARRRADKIQATPSWADQEAITALYAEAQRLTEATGIQFHIDHEVPLNSDVVCGLHVETNLQLLPWYENLAKSNKFEIQ